MKKLIIASTVFVLLLTGCSSVSSPKSTPTAPVEKNVLTGLPGGNGPILAVKIDDTNAAHPQVGLEQADIVYVEQVEGGLTRLAAIFTSTIPTDVGPVRSARISDLDILAQYGRVGFAFSGAQSKFYPKISAANLVNLSADRNSAAIYYRDASRSAPTNLILRAKDLMNKALNQDKSQIDLVKSVGFTFGDIGNFGTPITSMKLPWPAVRYGATWSAVEKRWLLAHNDTPDLSAKGTILGSPTIIIQKVSITNSEYRDREGGITPFSNTVGTGSGYLLREGKAIPITWSRPSQTQGTSWTLADGTPANLIPGQIWVMLTDQSPIFTYPKAASASPSASK